MTENREAVLGSGTSKIYDPPRLTVYGDLSRLTTDVGGLQLKNDQGGGKDKTI
jgi:hypothetical protein